MIDCFYKISSIASSIAVIIASVIAAYQYWQQKTSESRGAFTDIVNEINQIESIVSEFHKLQMENKLNHIEMYSSAPIIEENYWNRYKHLIMKKLDQTDIKILDEFYYNASQMERARKELSNSLAANWYLKAQTMQNEKIKIFKNSKDNSNNDKYFDDFFNETFTFIPSVPSKIFSKYFSLYRSIITSVTYKKLVELSYFK